MKWTSCFDYAGKELKDNDDHVVYLLRAGERFVPMGKLYFFPKTDFVPNVHALFHIQLNGLSWRMARMPCFWNL